MNCDIVEKFNQIENSISQHIYKEKKGSLYCLYNPMFAFYGKHVYKCGESGDENERLKGYITCYVDPPTIIYSVDVNDCVLCEQLLFFFLKNYRLRSNREFFQCDIEIIKETMNKVVIFEKTYSKSYILQLFKKNIFIKKNIFPKEKILNACDINKNQYDKLKQLDCCIEDKYKIEKYLYKLNWNVNVIDDEFLEKAYMKTHILYNNKSINENLINIYQTIDENYLDDNLIIKQQKLDAVNELLKELKFKDARNIFIDVAQTKDDFVKNQNTAINNCKIFNDSSILILFGLDKKIFVSNKSFMGFINSILKEYGIGLKSISSSLYVDKKKITCKKIKLYKHILK